MDELIDKFSEKIAENPRYGYLIASGILLLCLIGVICGLKWTYQGGTWGLNWVRETFVERAVRFWHGVLLFLLLVLCIVGFFSTK